MPMKLEDKLAVAMASEQFADTMQSTGCPPKVGIVAMKMFIWVSEHGDEMPLDIEQKDQQATAQMEKFWNETPDRFFDKPIGHA
jgi:hypothetical protein